MPISQEKTIVVHIGCRDEAHTILKQYRRYVQMPLLFKRNTQESIILLYQFPLQFCFFLFFKMQHVALLGQMLLIKNPVT